MQIQLKVYICSQIKNIFQFSGKHLNLDCNSNSLLKRMLIEPDSIAGEYKSNSIYFYLYNNSIRILIWMQAIVIIILTYGYYTLYYNN